MTTATTTLTAHSSLGKRTRTHTLTTTQLRSRTAATKSQTSFQTSGSFPNVGSSSSVRAAVLSASRSRLYTPEMPTTARTRTYLRTPALQHDTPHTSRQHDNIWTSKQSLTHNPHSRTPTPQPHVQTRTLRRSGTGTQGRAPHRAHRRHTSNLAFSHKLHRRHTPDVENQPAPVSIDIPRHLSAAGRIGTAP